MSVLPACRLLIAPRLLTSATASSLVRKSQKQVMSLTEPSAKVACTRTGRVSPALLKANSEGVTETLLTSPRPYGGGAPLTIHSRRMLDGHECLLNRMPPPCSTWP